MTFCLSTGTTMSIDHRADAAPDGAELLVDDHPSPVDSLELAEEEATSWADGATREALLVIAEGITHLAGFDVAAVSVVRDSQHMQVMAVAGGDEAREALLGTYTPLTR